MGWEITVRTEKNPHHGPARGAREASRGAYVHYLRGAGRILYELYGLDVGRNH